MSETASAAKAWYLIYTKPRSEELARDNLQRQGYETYLPLMKASRRRRGRYYTNIEAMFPRYLFIHLDSEYDNWMPIRSTLGVTQLVRFGMLPAQVPTNLIAALHANETEQGIQNRPLPQMQPGDTVEIIEGPMTGLRGTFERLVSNERVALLLDIVGKHSRVTLSRHEIRTAS
jgi:transcriptional antiterminator RfaH